MTPYEGHDDGLLVEEHKSDHGAGAVAEGIEVELSAAANVDNPEASLKETVGEVQTAAAEASPDRRDDEYVAALSSESVELHQYADKSMSGQQEPAQDDNAASMLAPAEEAVASFQASLDAKSRELNMLVRERTTLVKQIATYKKDCEDYKACVAELQSELDKLVQEAETMLHVTTDLRTKLDRAENAHNLELEKVKSELQKQIDTLQSEISSHAGRMEKLAQQNSSYKEQIDTYEALSTDQQTEMENLINDFAAMSEESHSLKKALNEAERAHGLALKQAREELQKDAETWKSKAGDLETELNKLLEEKTLLEKLTKEQESRLADARNSVDSKQTELESQLEKLQAIKTDLQQRLDQAAVEHNRAIEQAEASQTAKIESQAKDLADLEQRLQDSSTEKEDLHVQIEKLASLQRESTTKQVELERQIESIQNFNEALKNQLIENDAKHTAALAEANNSSQQELATVTTKVTSLEAEVGTLKTENEALKSELEENGALVAQAMEEKSSLLTQRDALNEEKTSLEHRLEEANAERARIQEQLDAEKRNGERLLEDARAENSQLQSKMEEHTTNAEKLLSKQAGIACELQEAKSAIRSLREELEEAQSQRSQAMESAETMQANVAQLEGNISRLKQDRSEMTGKILSLEEQTQQSLAEVEKLRKSETGLTERLDEIRTSNESLAAKLQDAENETLQKQQELDRLMLSIDGLVKSRDGLDAENKDLQTLIEVHKLRESQALHNQLTLQSDADRLSSNLSSLKEEKSELQSKVTTLEEQNREHQSIASNHAEQVALAQSKLDNLQATRSDLEEQLQEKQDKLDRLELSVSKMEQEREGLAGENKELQTQVEVHKLEASQGLHSQLTLQSELETIQAAHGTVVEQLKESLGAHAVATLKNEELTRENADLQERQAELVGEVASTWQKVEQEAARRVAVEEENESLKERSRTHESQAKEAADKQLELESEINTIQSANTELERQYTSLQEELESLEKVMEMQATTASSLKKDADLVAAENKSLKAQIQANDLKSSQVSDEYANLSDQLEKLKSTKSSLDEKLRAAQSDHTMALRQVRCRQEDIEQLEGTISDLQGRVALLVSEKGEAITILEEKVSALSKDVEKEQGLVEALQKSLDEATRVHARELEKLDQGHQRERGELASKIADQELKIELARVDNDSLKSQLQMLKKESEAENLQFRGELETLETVNEGLREQLQEARNDISMLTQENDDSANEADMERIEHTISSLERDLGQMTSEYAQMQFSAEPEADRSPERIQSNNVVALKAANEALEERLQEVEREHTQLMEEARQSQADETTRLSGILRKLEAELRDVKAENSNLTGRVDEMSQAESERKGETDRSLQRMQKKLFGLQSSNALFEKQLMYAKKEAQESMIKLRHSETDRIRAAEEVKEFQRTITGLYSRIADLQRQQESKSNEAASYRTQLDQLWDTTHRAKAQQRDEMEHLIQEIESLNRENASLGRDQERAVVAILIAILCVVAWVHLRYELVPVEVDFSWAPMTTRLYYMYA